MKSRDRKEIGISLWLNWVIGTILMFGLGVISEKGVSPFILFGR